VAGLVGAILAAERRHQAAAAVATLAVAQVYNQLLLVVDSISETAPPALVLLAVEAWHRHARGARTAPSVTTTHPGPRRP
jgi:hypothetical protein